MSEERIAELERDVQERMRVNVGLIAENAYYRRVLSNRSGLEKRFVGAIRAAVHDHGPITESSAPSAAKRVIGEMYAAFKEGKPSPVAPQEEQ